MRLPSFSAKRSGRQPSAAVVKVGALVGVGLGLGYLFMRGRGDAPGEGAIVSRGGSGGPCGNMGSQPINTTTLKGLHPGFAAKLNLVMDRLKARGFQPTIGSGWRNTAWQAGAKAKGGSQLTYSLHNVVNPKTCEPAALAADVVDARWGWGSGGPDPKDEKTVAAGGFFRALGEEVKRAGMRWGGDYSQKDKSGRSKSIWTNFGMGWDPAHVVGAQETPKNLKALQAGGWPPAFGGVPAPAFGALKRRPK